MAFVLTTLIVLVILLANEFWYRKRAPHDEFSRKFVHITVGSFVAFWPFYLSWDAIRVLSIAFLIVVSVSRMLGLFQAIHSVQRPTWGEVFFASAVGIITLITDNKWVYAAALLQMSLADGLAAVIGTRYSGQHKYSVFSHAKSVAGTTTFFVVSLVVLAVFNSHLPHHLNPAEMVGISALASVLENVFIVGLDNLLVPLVVALLIA